MKKSKVMMFSLIFLLMTVMVETSIICEHEFQNSKEKENSISKYSNTILNECNTNTTVVNDITSNTDGVANLLVDETLASLENTNVETKSTNKADNTIKKEAVIHSNEKNISIETKPVESNQEQKEEPQEKPKETVTKTENSVCELQPVVASCQQVEIPVPTVNIDVKPEEPVSQPSSVPSEEYRYNDTMTQTIINIINNNPSQYMIQDGYSVVVDNSITSLTNQFTFSEQRVINKVSMKAGTIKVYAQDYYLNGEFLFTECYIF